MTWVWHLKAFCLDYGFGIFFFFLFNSLVMFSEHFPAPKWLCSLDPVDC